jgi:hypothetical protein
MSLPRWTDKVAAIAADDTRQHSLVGDFDEFVDELRGGDVVVRSQRRSQLRTTDRRAAVRESRYVA